MYFVQRPFAAFERGQERQQDIRVVRDLVEVEDVLVVVMCGLVGVQILLQLNLHRGIRGLRAL